MTKMRSPRRVGMVLSVVLASAGVLGGSARAASCAEAGHAGGSWPSYGHDAANTRHQEQETVISPGRAATLSPVWQFSAPAEDAGASFSGTPTIAGGCLYVGSQSGWVYAVNADSGELVWSKLVEEDPDVPALAGAGGINSSIAVANGFVYASVATYEHPYVAAIDPATGDVVWATVMEDQTGAGTHSSPLVVGDVLLVGWDTAGVEFDAEGRKTAYGGFAVIDAITGQLLKHTYSIPPEDRPQGFSGGNIWSSFAADPSTKYAYVGTAAPYSPQHEHARTNAILKVDIDRSRANFGEVVASYKGVHDNFVETTEQLPCVPLVPGTNFAEGTGPCQKLDLDFAAAPNILTDSTGRTVVGELQKAGVYHLVDASTMEGLHQVVVGNMAAGFAPTNMGTPSFDGSAIYGVGGSANTMFAIDRDSADFRWRSETVDSPLHFNPVATANGVVYTANGSGVLTAHDARTGVLVLAARTAPALGSGVSVARNTVYAAGGGTVTAFRQDPARDAEAGIWTAVLSSIPTPPATPHLDKPPV